MSRTPRQYLIGLIPAAQRDACHAVLGGVSSSLANTFSVPIGPVVGDAVTHHACDANLTAHVAARLQAVCQPFGVSWHDEGPLVARAGNGKGLGRVMGDTLRVKRTEIAEI
jgi:hypothetical protein